MHFSLILQSISLRQDQIELYVPDAGAVREAFQKGRIPFPYWSQVWPAAKAMALFLLQHPHYTKAKRVIELGAGLGLPSLVTARHAAHVLCTDMVPEAVETVRQSASHLGLKNITAEVLDWQHLPKGLEADVLLLSDINYEPAAFETMQKVIQFFLKKGTTVLLSTPQRLMAKEFIALLLADCTQQEEIMITHEEKYVLITVIVLERRISE